VRLFKTILFGFSFFVLWAGRGDVGLVAQEFDHHNLRLGPLIEITETGNDRGVGMGARIEWFVSPLISLDYQYLFGSNGQGNFYCHVPGALAGFLALASGYYSNPWQINGWYSNEADGLLALAFLLPEGLSLHFYPHPKLELAPALAPLGADYNIRNNGRTSITGSLMLRAHYQPIPRFSVSPALGLRFVYSTGFPSLVYGLGFGLKI
jgi:hypothetical protein